MQGEPVRADIGHSELRQDPSYPPANTYPPPNQAAGSGGRWIASTDGSAGTVTPVAAIEAQPAEKRMPLVQLIRQPQIALDYDVVKVGPSGVGRAEVWMTRDDGRNWEKFANVDDLKQGPLIVDLSNQSEGAHEGVYGFTLIVYSKAGLARRPPLSGEPPDIRVELDMTPPDAKIGVPEQDPKDRNSLILRWSANDRNLDVKPICLFWSKQHDGPWQAIGSDLTNSGHFTWHLPPDPPERVFLRLCVRDKAGNVSEVITPSAVLVDLSEPEVHLRGVASTYRQP
jgi:hypothetical protein